MRATLERLKFPKRTRVFTVLPPYQHPAAVRAEAALRRSKYRQLRGLHCRLAGNHLILLGQVSSFYMKQLAQVEVQQLPGLPEIVNHVCVVYPHDQRLVLGPERQAARESAGERAN